jgi:hypothetical protein
LVAEGDPRDLRTSSKDPWVKAFFNREIPQEENRSAAPPGGETANGISS